MNLATRIAAPPFVRGGVSPGKSLHVDPCELLKMAVQAVLVDSGFIIQSPTSLKAHETVTKLLQWCGSLAHHPALHSTSIPMSK